MIRLNLVYDLLQTTKISSSTVNAKRENTNTSCNIFYWQSLLDSSSRNLGSILFSAIRSIGMTLTDKD